MCQKHRAEVLHEKAILKNCFVKFAVMETFLVKLPSQEFD